MARKNYPEEFRRDAVELYRSTEGATIKQIADELGIYGNTLSLWVKAAGVPVRSRGAGGVGTPAPVGPESVEEEVARLRARVAELEATAQRLGTEKEILQKAAKYFAGETNW